MILYNDSECLARPCRNSTNDGDSLRCYEVSPIKAMLFCTIEGYEHCNNIAWLHSQ